MAIDRRCDRIAYNSLENCQYFVAVSVVHYRLIENIVLFATLLYEGKNVFRV